MNNVTTPETSARLKAAGFPQPEYEKGQFWYDEDGNLFLVFGFKNGEISGTYLQRSGYFGGGAIDKGDCFAPTATDILRELDFEFNLWFSPQKGEYFISKDIGHFCGPENIASHANSAEAAAPAYLSLNEKTEQ